MAKDKYTPGATVQVISRNADGVPSNRIERDTDGQLWHCVNGKNPVSIDHDEVESIVAETAQTKAHDSE